MSSATINDFLQAITSSDSSRDDLNEIYNSLVKFSEVTSANKEVRVFLTNDIHDSESKLTIIRDIIGESRPSINFFKTIIDFNILSDLISSYEFFLKKLRIILERVKIDVYVASLNDEKKKIINDELVNIWGQNLEINYNLDVSIIGGIILQVEDKLYDGSIRGKLEKFNNIL